MASIPIKDKIEYPFDTVTLYHGTHTGNLLSILKNGILPREKTNQDNWGREGEDSEILSSVKTMAYMTNKWHYFYAFSALHKTLKENPETIVYPCYVEAHVPKEILFADEDIHISDYYRQKLLSTIKKNGVIELDSMESLAYYGTVAMLGGVKPEWIKSITVLTDPETIRYFINENSPYMVDAKKWQKGKGKGKVKLKELWEKEAKSDLNGTWFVRDFPAPVSKIRSIQFFINPETNKLAIQFQTS